MAAQFQIADMFVGLSARDTNLTKIVQGADEKSKGLRTTLQKIGPAADEGLGKIRSRMSQVQDGAIRLRSAFASIATAIAGAATISLFTQQARESAKLDSVLRSTGNTTGYSRLELDRMNDSIRKNVDFTKLQIIQVQAGLARFQNLGKLYQTAIKLTLDYAAATGNLESAIERVGKALDKPSEGIGALDDVGIFFTDTEKEVIKAMEEAGRVAEVQAVILEKLQQKVGGTAEALNKFDGGLSRVKNNMQDAGATAGGTLMKGLQPIINVVSKMVDMFSNLSPATQQGLTGIAAVGTVTTQLVKLLPILKTGLMGAFGLMLTPIGGVVAALTLFGTLLGILSTQSGSLGNAVRAGFKSIGEAIMAVWNVLTNLGLAWETLTLTISELLTHAYERVAWFATSSWETIKYFFSGFAAMALGAVSTTLKALGILKKDIDTNFAVKAAAKGPNIPEFKGTDFTGKWKKNSAEWDKALDKTKKKAEEARDAMTGGKATKARLDMSLSKKEEMRIEIVTAADAFKQNLQFLFEQNQKDKQQNKNKKLEDNQKIQINQADKNNQALIQAVRQQKLAGLAVR